MDHKTTGMPRIIGGSLKFIPDRQSSQNNQTEIGRSAKELFWVDVYALHRVMGSTPCTA